jgi:hypothetical protein
VTTGYTNTTPTLVEAYNKTTHEWDDKCLNGTFMSNNTYRINRRTINGSTDYTWARITYSLAGTATTGENNVTWKALNNNSFTGGAVFNIVGIVIMIGAIMSIIGIIYSYLRPY